MKNEPIIHGSTNLYGFGQADNVWSLKGVIPTIITDGNRIGHSILINEEEEENKTKIRKLTEDETMRFMGFEQKDTEACRKAGLSRANIYHQSGDSIITTIMASIFGELLEIDYKSKVEDYCEKLAKEKMLNLF